jgi:hypothetical protein
MFTTNALVACVTHGVRTHIRPVEMQLQELKQSTLILIL